MPPYVNSCGICHGDPLRRKFVEKELAAKTPHTQIELKARSLGIPVKRETIRKHVNVCLVRGVTNLIPPEPEVVEVDAPAPPPPPRFELDKNGDFAVLVRAEAIRRLEAGELKVRAVDGLQAQNIIDRREEKQKDREIVLVLGRLLAGQQSIAPTAVIEGQYSEVNDDIAHPLEIEAGNAVTSG